MSPSQLVAEDAVDVVVVDYADIVDASNMRLEFRHQVGDVWLGLKRLSAALKCLVGATG